MQITREYIQSQIDELKKQYDLHVANANAVNGAIQLRQQDLAYLELPEPACEGTPPHEGS